MFKRLTLFFVATFTLLNVITVSALGLGGVSGKPAGNPYSSEARTWFIYNLAPGTEHKDAVEVYNPTDQIKTVVVYPADSTPSSDGGFALKQKVEAMTDVGSWISLEKNEVTLNPGEVATIPFTIKIPADKPLDVGEHSGGIMIEDKQPNTVANGQGIILNTRVGIRVYINIPGDIVRQVDFDFLKENVARYRQYKLPFGILSEFSLLKVPALYDYQMGVINNGNVSTDVKYEFRAEDVLFGKNVVINKQQKTERNTPTVTHFEWEPPLFGKYSIQVKASYEGKEASSSTTEWREISSQTLEIWIIPWDLIVAIVLLGLVIVFAFLIRRAIKGKVVPPMSVAKPKKPTKVVRKPPAKKKATNKKK